MGTFPIKNFRGLKKKKTITVLQIFRTPTVLFSVRVAYLNQTFRSVIGDCVLYAARFTILVRILTAYSAVQASTPVLSIEKQTIPSRIYISIGNILIFKYDNNSSSSDRSAISNIYKFS